MSANQNTPAVHSISDLMSTAKLFAESGMFSDAKQVAQAFVKIQAGAELGIPPFASMSGVHIILGKPTIGAGLMASRVKASGKYDYQVLENTELVCRIEFLQGKKSIGISEFTIEQAKKAQTKNIDKFPKNMLFARAMSNGVKFFCPDVFSGPVYVPEEMNGVEDTTYTEVPNEPEQAATPTAEYIKLDPEQPNPDANPITIEQKTQILLLLNNSAITKEEKEKMVTKINTFDTSRAEKTVEKLKKTIEERTNAAVTEYNPDAKQSA